MSLNSAKLVILRGNSGSGKSTVAKRLRELSQRKTAIVEQDYVRRVLLKEKDVPAGDNIDLLHQIVAFALSRDYDVILEGILHAARYRSMLEELIQQTPQHYVYYFDVSLAETLKRHTTKPNAHEFGEKEMREWYIARDMLNVANEVIIPESHSFEESVALIKYQAGI